MTAESRDDDLAAAGFADGSTYHRARPGYAPDALDFLADGLALGPTSRLLDLGAGTGLFSAQIRARCGELIAVEPSASMRRAFAEALPDVEVLDGTDVAIPLPDASVDAVTVAQAFHWFDPVASLVEIHRVLRPGGGLGLVWNERDERVDWVDEMSHMMRWHECAPYDVGMDFTAVLEAGPFSDVERFEGTTTQTLDRHGLVARVASTSYVVAMDDAERNALLAEVRRFADTLDEPIHLPHVTTAYVAVAA